MNEHDEDPLAPARGIMYAFGFAFGMYLLAGVVIAVLLNREQIVQLVRALW